MPGSEVEAAADEIFVRKQTETDIGRRASNTDEQKSAVGARAGLRTQVLPVRAVGPETTGRLLMRY